MKHVTGYTGFSSNTSEQEGNYLALKVDADSEDAVVTIELVGGTKGPVTLDDDGKDSATKTYGLTRLILETE